MPSEGAMISKAISAILDQGILGSILIILFFLFKKFIERLFKVVENNTVALTQTSEALHEVKDVVRKCENVKKG